MQKFMRSDDANWVTIKKINLNEKKNYGTLRDWLDGGCCGLLVRVLDRWPYQATMVGQTEIVSKLISRFKFERNPKNKGK